MKIEDRNVKRQAVSFTAVAAPVPGDDSTASAPVVQKTGIGRLAEPRKPRELTN